MFYGSISSLQHIGIMYPTSYTVYSLDDFLWAGKMFSSIMIFKYPVLHASAEEDNVSCPGVSNFFQTSIFPNPKHCSANTSSSSSSSSSSIVMVCGTVKRRIHYLLRKILLRTFFLFKSQDQRIGKCPQRLPSTQLPRPSVYRSQRRK